MKFCQEWNQILLHPFSDFSSRTRQGYDKCKGENSLKKSPQPNNNNDFKLIEEY